MIVSLIVVVAITVGGLIAMNAFSHKVDKKNAFSLHSGGRAKIVSTIKLIPQFYDDFLTSNRKTNAKILNCIPPQSEDALQDFTQCNANKKMSDFSELNSNYQNSVSGRLPTIVADSFAETISLVGPTEVALSGTETAPALYDIEGSPCTTNCHFSLVSYMVKEKNPNNPGDVLFAFKLSELKASGIGFIGKTEWYFVPIVKEIWDAMTYSLADSVVSCPTGTFAMKVNANGTVICRDTEMDCFDGQMLVGINDSGAAICAPEPIWPAPALTFNQVPCDSWDYKGKTCPYTTPANASIKDVSVAYKRSKSGCSAGSSFGFTRTPPSLWVKSGCRATFNVETACDAGYALSSGACVPVSVGSWSPDLDNDAKTCTNKPSNSHYTGSGGGSNSCPWACDSGFEPNASGGCTLIPVPTPTPTPAPTATPSPTATPAPTP